MLSARHRAALLALCAVPGCFDGDGAGRRGDAGIDAPALRDAGEDGGVVADAGVAVDAGKVGTDFVPRPPCDETSGCEPSDFCVTVGTTGLRSCVDMAMEPLACMPNAPQDCCVDADCNGGLCVSVIVLAGACGGTAGANQRNTCAHDECSSDADCAADEVCAPNGRSEVRGCVPAACRSDDDCTEHDGGRCELLDLDCCASDTGEGIERRPELACVYPQIGCQLDRDCPRGQSCVVRDGRAECSDSCF